MTTPILVLVSLACVCAVSGSARVGAVSVAKVDPKDEEPMELLRQRRHVGGCSALRPCSLAFFCDPRTSQCVARHGLCTLLFGGRWVAGNWRDGGCFSADAFATSGACYVLVDGSTVLGNWRHGLCML